MNTIFMFRSFHHCYSLRVVWFTNNLVFVFQIIFFEKYNRMGFCQKLIFWRDFDNIFVQLKRQCCKTCKIPTIKIIIFYFQGLFKIKHCKSIVCFDNSIYNKIFIDVHNHSIGCILKSKSIKLTCRFSCSFSSLKFFKRT